MIRRYKNSHNILHTLLSSQHTLALYQFYSQPCCRWETFNLSSSNFYIDYCDFISSEVLKMISETTTICHGFDKPSRTSWKVQQKLVASVNQHTDYVPDIARKDNQSSLGPSHLSTALGCHRCSSTQTGDIKYRLAPTQNSSGCFMGSTVQTTVITKTKTLSRHSTLLPDASDPSVSIHNWKPVWYVHTTFLWNLLVPIWTSTYL